MFSLKANFLHCVPSVDWFVAWKFIDLPVHWLIDILSDWYIEWLIYWVSGWLIDWMNDLIYCFRLIDWLIGRLTRWSSLSPIFSFSFCRIFGLWHQWLCILTSFLHTGKAFLSFQVKNKNVRRGYFQKSVVLISKFPFLNVFREVLRVVATEYFDNGQKALEYACKEIDSWTATKVGVPLSLPLFGHNLCVTIPSKLDGALPGASYPSNLATIPSALNIPITSIHDLDFVKSFQGFFAHLHVFWELILCNEVSQIFRFFPITFSFCGI